MTAEGVTVAKLTVPVVVFYNNGKMLPAHKKITISHGVNLINGHL
jgi:hypothetical protein